MRTTPLIVFASSLFFFAKIQAQCGVTETISICDMTVVDHDTDGVPDGIINLYDEYNALTGSSISLADGTWFDPGFNFALDEANGDLHLWDLDDASEAITDYQFQLIDNSSGCTDGILVRLNVVLGPFSGVARPVLNLNDVNLEVCDLGSSPTDVCVAMPDVNLFEALESVPSPHLNGEWVYNGSSPNFVSLSGPSLTVSIPYTPGPSLVDQETFELTYRVSGIPPCGTTIETTINVSVARQVFSGYPINQRICEQDILNGDYDLDISLLGDDYLLLEDLEGVWQLDTHGQITSLSDSDVNIKAVYDQIVLNNKRFGCAEFSFEYSVDQRSGVCMDAVSNVEFKIYEYLRPFTQNGTLEFCEDDPTAPASIDLYDQLEFTVEDGVLFDYFSQAHTNWVYISGPSDLGLVSSGLGAYTPLGTVNLTNADPGTYIFEYTVAPEINCPNDQFEVLDYSNSICSSVLSHDGFCNSESAQVILTIHPKLYAGEDTTGLTFCENDPLFDASVNLTSLLTTNGVDDPIYDGPLGVWTQTATGNPVTNPFTLPEINNQQIFDFTYTTTTDRGCVDSANLSFVVYEAYQSGTGSTLDVCNSDASFNLFDSLTGSPNTTGTWSGPNGFTTTDHNAIFDPATDSAGNYVYTVPDNPNDPNNMMCTGSQATLLVNLFQGANAGSNMRGTVCRSDLQADLLDYLDPSADSGGTFNDLDATNALTGSMLDVSQLAAGRYNFQYEVQGHVSCGLATALITITVQDVAPPTASNQTFCVSEGATIAELAVSGGADYNWYADATSTNVLPFSTLLVDGEDYFVTAMDINGCESPRVSISTTILPFNHADCDDEDDDCLKDGVSVNGDNQNDEFDLCNLPVSFPNFEINIFNRYGTKVYKGNQNTPLFKGVSNVSLTIGKELPKGIYFYIFDPKDGSTPPIQGNFYLSR